MMSGRRNPAYQPSVLLPSPLKEISKKQLRNKEEGLRNKEEGLRKKD
jgi:hypothetical protein